MVLRFKNKDLSTSLFVFVSILAFVLVGGFFFFLRYGIFMLKSELLSEQVNKPYWEADVIDPFITPSENLQNKILKPQISKDSPILGNRDAKLSIIYFSDYNCVYCQQQKVVMKQLMEEYGGKVNLVWKDYPDNDAESFSWQAAVAARCAGKQGKFWQYQDKLFNNDLDLDNNKLIELGKTMDMSAIDFAKCVKNKETENVVLSDMQEAQDLNISGVPFIFIGNQEIMGEFTKDELKHLIDIELENMEGE